MLEQATDVVTHRVAGLRVAVLIVEDGLAILPERLVRVHAGAVVTKERLGHERRRLAVLMGYRLDDVLVDLDGVTYGHHGAVVESDLGLSRRGHLVMVLVDVQAGVHHRKDDMGAQVLLGVRRREREVAALQPRAMREVRSVVLIEGAARVPDALFGIDEEVALVLLVVVAGAIEDEELRLRAPVAFIRNAGALQVLLRLAGDVARVPGVGLSRHGVPDVTDDRQGRHLQHRVNECPGGVRHNEHVGFVNGLESANAGAVKAGAVRKHGLVK